MTFHETFQIVWLNLVIFTKTRKGPYINWIKPNQSQMKQELRKPLIYKFPKYPKIRKCQDFSKLNEALKLEPTQFNCTATKKIPIYYKTKRWYLLVHCWDSLGVSPPPFPFFSITLVSYQRGLHFGCIQWKGSCI